MYFVSCNNKNKRLKIRLKSLTKDSVMDYICISLCIAKKERLFNTRILSGQRLFTCSGILKLSMAEA